MLRTLWVPRTNLEGMSLREGREKDNGRLLGCFRGRLLREWPELSGLLALRTSMQGRPSRQVRIQG